ncbi:NAD-P-binding protein [Lactarius akahatsu]|uniref:NAD-P-binding protein n=1 Tax=Lactarius akahatsu TaxID=416441 RepID=A0AAD4LRD1_9AGAM|nr:NAD-P-binding protein [Lactarius akahatsu]
MSGYKNFAVVGAGSIGSFIIRQLLTDKAAGTVKEVVVLTRQASLASTGQTHSLIDLSQGSKTTVDPAAKLIPVDYSDKESIKTALVGVDVVISTIAPAEVGVKLFVPSEFGRPTQGEAEGYLADKGQIQEQLKAIGLPYALFYTGGFADYLFVPFLDLDVTSGKVSIGGDGSKPIPFTSRLDIARYISYVLTHLPVDQLENRSFTITGDTKSFNEIFKGYQEKTGKKLEVTYIPVSELDARLASNPRDIPTYVHKLWAAWDESPMKTDNHLYPEWNPSSVLDNLPVA